MNDLDVGIVGASGYTGSELIRILAEHPRANIRAVTSEAHAGKKLQGLFPHLNGLIDLELIRSGDMDVENDVDIVFLALPHTVSMGFVKEIWNEDVDVIDLSGDFRLSSVEDYEKWYSMEHSCPELNDKAVYGLPELFRETIANARLVSNPGCYPTSAIIGLAPFLKEKLIDPSKIIVDSKSGVTGAGVKVRTSTHFPNINEDFRAYGIGTHRHTPEIEDVLSIYSGSVVSIQFTPHLLPLDRGILSTIYAKAQEGTTEDEIQEALHSHYSPEEFIRIREEPPSLKQVRGSNYCDVHAHLDSRTGNMIIVTVIDNLVKGASGQAVQNMNIMKGFDEGTGLRTPPLMP
ncbi:MAG: N-acetyl-gamma-glutamyl-phosphate reductase [Candidatus Thermoplasmatota archaeon]|nr:N-acetyl-gamma-glutamyl-phosphate reductase [Candidatus Thermoplasmatota archaeon]